MSIYVPGYVSNLVAIFLLFYNLARIRLLRQIWGIIFHIIYSFKSQKTRRNYFLLTHITCVTCHTHFSTKNAVFMPAKFMSLKYQSTPSRFYLSPGAWFLHDTVYKTSYYAAGWIWAICLNTQASRGPRWAGSLPYPLQTHSAEFYFLFSSRFSLLTVKNTSPAAEAFSTAVPRTLPRRGIRNRNFRIPSIQASPFRRFVLLHTPCIYSRV